MISVISCTYNRGLEMYRGLRTVLTQLDIEPLELVLVDDGSIDDTKQYADRLQSMAEVLGHSFKYIYLDHPEPRISCIPRNVGIKAASGDTLIFTEPEALHMQDSFSKLIQKHQENPNNTILASQVWTMGQRIQEKLNEKDFENPARILSHEYAMLSDGNMQNTKAPDADFAITGESYCNAGVLFLTMKKWVVKIGGFDESFEGHGFDDFDLFNRLAKTGHGILKCPDIAVIHQWHKKEYPYNIYDKAKENGTISEANIAAGKYKANKGRRWGQS